MMCDGVMMGDLIGSAEACELLRVNRMTLMRWVALDKIKPATKLPGKNGAFLFHREDVEALLSPEPGSAA
jgi:excisionase family DNA binding protein